MAAIVGMVKHEGTASAADLSPFGRSDSMLKAALERAVVGSCRLALHSSWEAPFCDERAGLLVAWEGRLDNRAILCERFKADRQTPNAQLVAMTYEKWGDECFIHLRGEWAVAIVDGKNNVALLARDPSGARPMYYAVTNTGLLWSTYLESLEDAGVLTELSHEYLYRYLAGIPLSHLTPYCDVLPVLAGHFVKFSARKVSTQAFWTPIFDERIRASNEEFEAELFRLFAQSVARRAPLGENAVAQLSGGMDSSCIVGMSDHLRREQGLGADSLLRTISFIDPEEPHSNEEPFILAMESHRGKPGQHLHLSYLQRTLTPPEQTETIWLAPGGDAGTFAQELRYQELLSDEGCTAVLSGIGGDELLGGVPTGLPEMADLLSARRFSALLDRAVKWCLPNRRTVWELLGEVWRYRSSLLTDVAPPTHAGCLAPIPAFQQNTVHQEMLKHHVNELRPSTISNALAWWSIPETQPSGQLGNCHRAEYRYPYLDLDLVEFLLRVPRQQLVEPGQRRSLMKRSLGRLLPHEVLSRRRKGFISRTPITMLTRNRSVLAQLSQSSLSAEMKLVSSSQVARVAAEVEKPENFQNWPFLLRFACLELWLRSRVSESGQWHRKLCPDSCLAHPGISSSAALVANTT